MGHPVQQAPVLTAAGKDLPQLACPGAGALVAAETIFSIIIALLHPPQDIQELFYAAVWFRSFSYVLIISKLTSVK